MIYSTDKQTPTNVLFLGDLPILATADEVSRVLVAHGDDVVHDFSIDFCFHEGGRRRRYGFVRFPSVEACQQAHGRLKNGFKILGRHVRVRYGVFGATDKISSTSLSSSTGGPTYSIYIRFCSVVTNFSPDTIGDFFGKHGVVVAVCILESEKVTYNC